MVYSFFQIESEPKEQIQVKLEIEKIESAPKEQIQVIPYIIKAGLTDSLI